MTTTTNTQEFAVYGTITLNVSMTVDSTSHEEAFYSANALLSNYNIAIAELTFETTKDDVTVDVCNSNVAWTSVYDEDEECYSVEEDSAEQVTDKDNTDSTKYGYVLISGTNVYKYVVGSGNDVVAYTNNFLAGLKKEERTNYGCYCYCVHNDPIERIKATVEMINNDNPKIPVTIEYI